MNDYERNADVRKTLTEQMHKGELPYAEYYIKLGGGEYTNDVWDIDGWQSFNKKGDVVVEVIEPVPSYEEYLSLTYAKEEDEKIIAEYEAENEELKEILERHKKATAKAQIRSCDLEIINAQLKELLKRAGIYAWNCGDTKLANKINEVLNE